MSKTKNIFLGIAVIAVISFTIIKKIERQQKEKEEVAVDINDVTALSNYMQGKWSYNDHTGRVNETFRYRFEIIGSTIKIWSDIGNIEDEFDMSDSPKVHEFSLSEVTRSVDGAPCRYLEFYADDASLTLRSINPIWISSNKYTAVHSGTGIPAWTRGWN